MFTGDRIPAAELYRIGVLVACVPREQLMDEAMKAAETIASMSLPSVLSAKEAVNRGYETTLAEGIRFETAHRRKDGGTFPVEVSARSIRVEGVPYSQSIIRDITDSLARQGIDRLLLLNGHGGNELKPLVRELHADSKVFTAVCDWFRLGTDLIQEIMDQPGEHADETETSLAMALVPELVQFEKADKGTLAKSPIEAINKGWFSITRPWHLLTSNTGAGDPSKSSADKGNRLLDALVERLGGAIHQMAIAPRSERFPYA